MIANRIAMPDKTLKIRIKLQPAESSTVSLDTPPKVYPKEVNKPTHVKGDRRPHISVLFILSGVVVFLMAGYFMFSGEKNETPLAMLPPVDPDVSAAQKSLHTKVETQRPSTPSEPSNVAIQDTTDPNYVKSKVPSSSQRETAENVHHSTPNEKELLKDPSRLQSISTTQDLDSPALSGEINDSNSLHDKAEPSTSFDNKEPSNLVAVDSDSTFTRDQLEAKENNVSSSNIHSNSASSMTSLPSNIARAQFTHGIKNREPIDHIEDRVHSMEQASKRLFYFTELTDLKGEKITHRWKHKGNTMAKVNFNVRGNRWRVYSSKNLTPSLKGKWQVVVTDSADRILLSDSIIYD